MRRYYRKLPSPSSYIAPTLSDNAQPRTSALPVNDRNNQSTTPVTVISIAQEQVDARSQYEAVGAMARFLLGEKCSSSCVFENFTNALVGLGGALEILVCTDLPSDFLAL